MDDEFLICRMEPEPRWEDGTRHHYSVHCHLVEDIVKLLVFIRVNMLKWKQLICMGSWRDHPSTNSIIVVILSLAGDIFLNVFFCLVFIVYCFLNKLNWNIIIFLFFLNNYNLVLSTSVQLLQSCWVLELQLYTRTWKCHSYSPPPPCSPYAF